MMDTLYLFPLNQSLTLKKIPQPYHIFEPRYQKMVDDALKLNKRISVLPNQESYENKVCVAGIPILLQKYEDGRMDIVITGVEKVLLGKSIKEDPYLEFSLSPIAEDSSIINVDDFNLLKELLMSKLQKQPHFEMQKDQFQRILRDPETVINYASLLLVPSIKDKCKILMENHFDAKISFILDKISPAPINIFEHIKYDAR